ncbi:hypothetical protein M8J77_024951 [Diaphorina citri]|nr:hypothetical protein M8J77_024951 [Diaphorina citri]
MSLRGYKHTGQIAKGHDMDGHPSSYQKYLTMLNISDLLVLWSVKQLCHKGIQGNDRVDILAKESITADILPTINSHDIKTHYKKSLLNTWNNKWKNLPSPNKLREIKDNVFQWDSSNLENRRDEIVITRIRIGHSLYTHGYLMDRANIPSCSFCNTESLSIKHIIIHCPALHRSRTKFNIQNSLSEALGDNNTSISNIILFLKDINIYSLI